MRKDVFDLSHLWVRVRHHPVPLHMSAPPSKRTVVVAVAKQASDWETHAEELKAYGIELPQVTDPRFVTSIRVLGLASEAQLAYLNSLDWVFWGPDFDMPPVDLHQTPKEGQ